MQICNRIFFDKPTGVLIYQTGEHQGTVSPHHEVTEIDFIDIPFGSINYDTHFIESIDAEGNPVIKEYPKELTPIEIENAKLKEDILLLKTENEVGGIL